MHYWWSLLNFFSITGSKESGAIVFPGTIRKYTFNVPIDFLTPLNDACTTFVYHSAVDLRKDIHSGLFGPLLVCKPGTLSLKNKQVSFFFPSNIGHLGKILKYFLCTYICMLTRKMVIQRDVFMVKTDTHIALKKSEIIVKNVTFYFANSGSFSYFDHY